MPLGILSIMPCWPAPFAPGSLGEMLEQLCVLETHGAYVSSEKALFTFLRCLQGLCSGLDQTADTT